MLCEWCGVAHDPAALCHARPRWTRRGFLSLALTGVAALVTTPLAPLVPPFLYNPTPTQRRFYDESIGEMVARAWADGRPEPNIFTSQWLLKKLKEEEALTYAPVRSSVYDLRLDRRRDRRAVRQSAVPGVRRRD